MSRLARSAALALLSLAAAPAWPQLSSRPPPGPLWEVQADGDAIQQDLGFIVPKKWKSFERAGFTSTRPDGASTKAHYVSDDGQMRLGILLQLRADVRGVELGPDVVWKLVQASAEAEFLGRAKSKPAELSSAEFRLGNRSPAGRRRWVRYDTDTGGEIQGLWWQNIGIWSVVVTMSGPEARRADIEAEADSLLREMPFPSAPLATELAVSGAKLLAGLRPCKGERPQGSGREILPSFEEATALGIVLAPLVLGQSNDWLISPVTRREHYCVIEIFHPREDLAVTAIEYRGPATEVWEARYGFALADGRGGYYQIERLPRAQPLESLLGEAGARRAYLNFSNNKRAALFAVFDDWPSYETAKRAVIALHEDPRNRTEPTIGMTSPAKGPVVVFNPDRVRKGG